MKGKTILIVDDSDLVAGMLSGALAETGCRVIRARNGVEGVETAYREMPDVIIMDVEMPLMQGYQASRLLKNRRGVKAIPIVMHTSLSEDKDKYWAMTSGADAFVNKDFDNLDRLIGTVRDLSDHPPYDEQVIREDAAGVNRDKVFEMIGSLFDGQLFRSTILNLLGELGRSMGSLEETVEGILGLVPKVCESHIAVLMAGYRKEARVFVQPSHLAVKSDVEDFLNVCYTDFYGHFPALSLEGIEPVMFGVRDDEEYRKLRIDGKRISSYFQWPLIGTGGTVVGTLHVGNFSNNYFSEIISGNITVFAEGAGIVLENSVLFKQVSEMQEKIRHVFSKFVPTEIIDDLVERASDEALMVGEDRSIVVLFSDIRSFTSITETNGAEAVVSFLNNHFRIMVDIIKKHGGSIDKFIGDAIFAIFGAPVSYEDNALRAARAAIEMIGSMSKVDLGRLKLPPSGYAIGIGLHEGKAIVGNIGSSDKFDYTAIGDTVNIASRLEGLTKHYRKRILVSEDMARKLKDEFGLREVDRVKVKGKLEATSVYCLNEAEGSFPPEAAKDYAKGLKLYKLGNWDTAQDYFRKVLEACPDDFLAGMFIERCVGFSKEAPPSWDGAVALDFK